MFVLSSSFFFLFFFFSTRCLLSPSGRCRTQMVAGRLLSPTPTPSSTITWWLARTLFPWNLGNTAILEAAQRIWRPRPWPHKMVLRSDSSGWLAPGAPLFPFIFFLSPFIFIFLHFHVGYYDKNNNDNAAVGVKNVNIVGDPNVEQRFFSRHAVEPSSVPLAWQRTWTRRKAKESRWTPPATTAKASSPTEPCMTLRVMSAVWQIMWPWRNCWAIGPNPPSSVPMVLPLVSVHWQIFMPYSLDLYTHPLCFWWSIYYYLLFIVYFISRASSSSLWDRRHRDQVQPLPSKLTPVLCQMHGTYPRACV